ncbi:hypothetical protein MUK70_25555 [Dyadobacter chenwenxiniae]|uniref:Uncharacterized protein n=1 Tax=Dyadobacter chenwenxiniae TaxID=2906456 RepID=A0A9X1PNZ7_9BACT|nr:hypothetical protein [Dyadobacter chenwenxiniae]MCF0064403.1 hypothetical protein [Dyadobacter chenwenxiniae]UON82392.1 hypothetical protein MUK70_25555 [Dyadobacter chenwenxiniae]
MTEKRNGKMQAKEAVSPEIFQGGDFGELLNNHVEKKIDQHEKELLSAVGADYGEALTLARNNDLDKAEWYMNKAHQEQENFSQTSLVYQLLDLHGLPVKAYFHYKKKEYKLAEQYLRDSTSKSADLVKEGFYMVECHRIQQLHNLARMYFKRNELEHGGQMISEALLYMTQEMIPTVDSNWHVDSLRQCPMSLRCGMILQLALETAGELLPPTLRQQELYKSAFGNWSEPLPGLTDCEPLNQWIKLKNLYLLEHSDEAFVESAIDFALTAPAQFDILKLVLIVNMTDTLRKTSNYDPAVYKDLSAFGQKLKVSRRYKLACFTYMQP